MIAYTLKIKFRKYGLRAVLTNLGTQAIQVWSLSNSRGWAMPHIEITDEFEAVHIIKTKTLVFTRDGPGFDTVEPGKRLKLKIRLNTMNWNLPNDLMRTNLGSVRVRLLLTSNTSKETEAYHIFTGQLVSNSIISHPPHYWMSND